MAMGVCTLVAAATAEVIRPNAPHGAPVASVGGCDSVLNALVRRWARRTPRTAPSHLTLSNASNLTLSPWA